ncbi:ABC transporter permease, partial [Clavibacter californiensis]
MTALRPAREDVGTGDRAGVGAPYDDGQRARRPAPGRATRGVLLRVA